MKTIQTTIDEPLLAEVDRVIQALETTRSAFIREALQLALQKYQIAEMEQRHAEGYARHRLNRESLMFGKQNRRGGSHETGKGTLVRL